MRTTGPDVPREVERWTAYVDDIDEEHLHLVVADGSSDRDGGARPEAVPMRLVAQLGALIGQKVTVRVMSDQTISIEDAASSRRRRAADMARIGELADLLSRVRERCARDDDGNHSKEAR